MELHTLNFLKISPLANWLDYFLDRQKLIDLLKDGKDISKIIELADQFIEQAIGGDKDIAQIEKKQLDQEDIILLRHKVDDLWLCASACFATCFWDLELITKSSNVIKIRAFMDRLTKWFFSESCLNSERLNTDPFGFISEQNVSLLTQPKIFVCWMYARWVMHVDCVSRFPAPPAKPTVSNPNLQVDPSLILAENLNQATIELRKRMSDAITLLENLATITTLNEMEVPGKECFYPKLDIVTQTSLGILTIFPVPSFNVSSSNLPWAIIQRKTLYDIMVAHFAAGHFLKAKTLLEKIISIVGVGNNHLEDNLEKMAKIDVLALDGYIEALGFRPVPTEEQTASAVAALPHVPGAASSLIQFVSVHKESIESWRLAVHVLKSGRCVSTSLMSEMNKPEARQVFLEEAHRELVAIDAALTNFKKTDGKRLNFETGNSEEREFELEAEKSQLILAINFICALCPGFVEDVENFESFGGGGYKWRGLVQFPDFTPPPMPLNEELEQLTTSGPPLWNIMTSVDMHVLREAFEHWDASQNPIPSRHHFSDVIAEPILSKCSKKNFNKTSILLWKLDQIAQMNNIYRWKAFVGKFANEITQQIQENSELSYLLCYESVHAEIKIWNNMLYRNEESVENREMKTTNFVNLVSNLLTKKQPGVVSTFSKITQQLSAFLLNNKLWTLLLTQMIDPKSFKGPYIDLARIMSAYFNKLLDEKNSAAATEIAIRHFWKVLVPTFEETSAGRRSTQNTLISKRQLLEFLALIKEANALNLFLTYSCYLYNSLLATSQLKLLEAEPMEIAEKDGPPGQKEAAPGPSSILTPAAINTQLLKNIDRRIWMQKDQIELWQSANIDEYMSRSLDLPFIEQLIELLCKNALLVNPVNILWLRINADFAFTRERYAEAITLYLEVITALDSEVIDGTPEGVEKLREESNMDLIYSKIVIALHALRMPTLSAICGQMRTDIKPHLPLVELILQSTALTVDAGPVYFPMIANVQLLEQMAIAYEKLDFPVYHQTLLKTAPSRALNFHNPREVLEREVEIRKQRFMEILCTQFFRQNSQKGRQIDVDVSLAI